MIDTSPHGKSMEESAGVRMSLDGIQPPPQDLCYSLCYERAGKKGRDSPAASMPLCQQAADVVSP